MREIYAVAVEARESVDAYPEYAAPANNLRDEPGFRELMSH